MARFIIADLTDPSSIPKELETIVPNLAVPVQPLQEGSSPSYCDVQRLLEVRLGTSGLPIRRDLSRCSQCLRRKLSLLRKER